MLSSQEDTNLGSLVITGRVVNDEPVVEELERKMLEQDEEVRESQRSSEYEELTYDF